MHVRLTMFALEVFVQAHPLLLALVAMVISARLMMCAITVFALELQWTALLPIRAKCPLEHALMVSAKHFLILERYAMIAARAPFRTYAITLACVWELQLPEQHAMI
jgi:hypothetical protein